MIADIIEVKLNPHKKKAERSSAPFCVFLFARLLQQTIDSHALLLMHIENKILKL
jgi:hypothetical protein